MSDEFEGLEEYLDAKEKSFGIDKDSLPKVKEIVVGGDDVVRVIYLDGHVKSLAVDKRVADHLRKQADYKEVHIGISQKEDYYWVCDPPEDDGESEELPDFDVELVAIPATLTQALLALGATCDF